MARYESCTGVSLTAGEALAIGRVVGLDASGTAIYPLDPANGYVGVTAEAAASGDVVSVNVGGGIVMIEAAGAFTAGDELVAGTDGRVDDTAVAVGDFVVGFALEDAAAAGDIVSVLLNINEKGAI